MSDDTDLARYRALELEMSEPSGLQFIDGYTDTLPPEPEPVDDRPEWERAYAGEWMYSTTFTSPDQITAAGDNAVFTAHTDENGKHLGYIVEPRRRDQ